MYLCCAGDEQQLLLDVDVSGVSSALQWLNKYKLRRKLALEDVSSKVAVWAAFDGDLKAGVAGAVLLAQRCMHCLHQMGAVQAAFAEHCNLHVAGTHLQLRGHLALV